MRSVRSHNGSDRLPTGVDLDPWLADIRRSPPPVLLSSAPSRPTATSPGSPGALLLGEQDQDAAVEQGLVLATSGGPVVGQGGVVRGRRAEDQAMPDDLRPAHPVEPGTVVAVAEDPPVVAGRVELAVVPVDDPVPRLVLVAVAGPLVGQLPQVAVQGREGPGRCCSPVVVRPSTQDRVDLREDGRRIAAP
jgi:hypothetical protein